MSTHRQPRVAFVVQRCGKEVIGGYWFIVAGSLQEGARIAAENPCLACGLSYEVRPIEHERASAYRAANETPSPAR